jgi:DNA-binding transcriptional regulator YhcF (GntR family)
MTDLSHLPLPVRQRFKGMTEAQQQEVIEKYNKEMTPELHAEIQEFVNKMLKKGHKPRRIKKMVKEKFKVFVV